jgi:hypothetical protein
MRNAIGVSYRAGDEGAASSTMSIAGALPRVRSIQAATSRVTMTPIAAPATTSLR